MSLDYLNLYLTIAAALIGLFTWKKVSPATKVIIALVVTSLLTDLISYFLGKRGINNLFMFHVNTPIEAFFCIVYFKLVLKEKKWIKTFIVLGAFLIVCLIDSFFIANRENFNEVSKSLESVILIVYSLSYYFYLYKNEPEVFIDQSQEFWIVSGILLYFSGALYTFLLGSRILSSPSSEFFGSWTIHAISSIIKYIFFIVAFLKRIRS